MSETEKVKYTMTIEDDIINLVFTTGSEKEKQDIDSILTSNNIKYTWKYGKLYITRLKDIKKSVTLIKDSIEKRKQNA